ncbi:hypothetical protein NLG97_g3957 [Lecanicillium saksenae]|uniref:Uncharacterized protein n=1 Tax=Lecanicillium saksenae TaxID=468837 RepID=A0ACC1QWM8_9HYPO|nr:hypothetical protein NLG97_g3957 [Lecanicillium saksenae]
MPPFDPQWTVVPGTDSFCIPTSSNPTSRTLRCNAPHHLAPLPAPASVPYQPSSFHNRRCIPRFIFLLPALPHHVFFPPFYILARASRCSRSSFSASLVSPWLKLSHRCILYTQPRTAYACLPALFVASSPHRLIASSPHPVCLLCKLDSLTTSPPFSFVFDPIYSRLPVFGGLRCVAAYNFTRVFRDPVAQHGSRQSYKAPMSSQRPGAFNSLRMGEVIRERVQDGVTGETRELQYTQCKIVGNGSFGVVFQTKLSPSGEDAAIKRVLQDKRFKNRELQIMRIVRHPNIVQLKAFYYSNGERKDEVYLNLVQEFVPETVYRASRFFNKMKTTMPILEVKLYIYQLFRALAYIHSQGICHRDIKPQNLLLDPTSGILKLCDFGSAKILVENEPNVSYICSRYYRAPELIFGATNYTTKIDVWSTGCVMAELMLGQPLFPGESGIDQLVEIIKVLGTPTREQIRTMNPNYMEHKFPQIKPHPFNKVFRKADANAIDLITKLLEYTPTEREAAVNAMVHPFFDELRDPETKLPDSRHGTGQLRDLPDLFDFTRHELSIAPDLNSQLVPSHQRPILAARGLDIDNLTPMTKQEMMAKLD